MKTVETVADEVLREGLDDWIPIDVLLWHAKKSAMRSGCEFKEIVRGVLRFLLAEDLVMIGDIGDSGFESWSISPVEAVDRAIYLCDSMGWEPFGGACWIANTKKGSGRVS